MKKQFKNTYEPNSISPPGNTLAELLEEIGMSQKDFAKRCELPEKTINEVIEAKFSISPEIALQFQRVLGTPAEFWNSREFRYREYLACKKENEMLQKEKNCKK
ncbi:HigA family addiction module antitoxin [Candidatus Berkiella aquae]|uniref:HigA family addiction module antidote protein n=1 Tax=Candidatus Berkiella aquae TaxID=295108 RepID=A0A0Q9YCY8_9GAMM|nr:HigA family addiction module antitoxin [Candidatus Berkiella aquae]MCS5709876.1 HigA family addiction module antidote protein [Candidatus Berkiella aquae]